MEISLFQVFTYFVAFSYLAAGIGRLALDLSESLKGARSESLLGKQGLSMHPFGRSIFWANIILTFSGSMFGAAVISSIKPWFVREWLLLTLPAVGIWSLELHQTRRDFYLFAAASLVNGLYEERTSGQDAFERLAKIVENLPPGDVQRGAWDALQRRRSGIPAENSWQAFKGYHPVIDELIFTLRLTDWQASPAFDLAMERLSRRASLQWDRYSRQMVFREKIQPVLRFNHAAVLVGLAVILADGLLDLPAAWLGYSLLGLIVLICILATGVFLLVSTKIWLRRVVGYSLMIASLMVAWQSPRFPDLFELQALFITQSSEGITTERIQKSPPVLIVDGESKDVFSGIPDSFDHLPSRERIKPLPVESMKMENEKLWNLLYSRPK